MKRRFLQLVFVLVVCLIVSASKSPLGATDGRETHYTVRYSCIIGPYPQDNVVGEWDVDCDGNWTGWGWMPGHDCTLTDTSYGNFCY